MRLLLAFTCLLPFVLAVQQILCASKGNCPCYAENGGWGHWSSFGPCSRTCGTGGVQKRHRYCDSPIPRYGGKPCDGDSIEVKPCDGYTECPVDGGWGYWTKGECTKKCDGGEVIYRRHCNNPQPKHCGKPCEGPSTKTELCNTHPCPKPCQECFLKAEKYANQYGKPEFVGHACRVDRSHCFGLKNGIRDMYTANHWFFLHCSPDGPWCKPCATRGLVYNPRCGQCEVTGDGCCTGPMKWRYQNCGKGDELMDDLEKDKDMW